MTVFTRRQSADDNMSRALTGQLEDAKSFVSAKDCRGGYCKVQVALHFFLNIYLKLLQWPLIYIIHQGVFYSRCTSPCKWLLFSDSNLSFCVDLFLFDEPASIDYTGPVFLSQYARPVFRVGCFALLLIQRCNSLSEEYFLFSAL